MTLPVLAAVQWLHVLAGTLWFGTALTLDLLVLPSVRSLPDDVRQAWFRPFVERYGHVIGPAAGLTIVLGIARGLLGGAQELLASPYGITWTASLVLAIGLAALGAGVIAPAARALAATGGAEARVMQARLSSLGRLDLGGFLVLFTLMVAMRFGY
jgi:uncharacterized membrane protein